MSLLEDAILTLWEQGFSVGQIVYQVGVDIDTVCDVLDYYGY